MSGSAMVLGCRVERVDMSGAVELCLRAVEERRHVRHAALNAAKVVAMQKDTALREAVEGSDLVTADGQAVVWASRLLRDPLPERVAGIDLMENLLEEAAARGYGVYLLGATPETLAGAVRALKRRYPALRIVGSHHGYFDDEESPAICGAIETAAPDMLFVAMSTPRKELWLARHGGELGVPFVMGVGGALDVVAGDVRRAPAVLRRLGLEWAYRFAQEPRRLWRRYLRTNTRFALLVARELVGGRLRRR